MSTDVEEQRSFVTNVHVHPGPDTITRLIKRVRALTNTLLPVEVEIEDISAATSAIITPEVVDAYIKAGGDFAEAVPFCLLRARAVFRLEGSLNPADYGETLCRATACEVLARRIIHKAPRHRLQSIYSTRYRYRESDGDASASTCALEQAIDQHCTIFLSSNESQEVVNALWKGTWVQQNNANDDIDYVEYHPSPDAHGFWAHLRPERMSVPRYHNDIQIANWLCFLFVYQMTVMSPAKANDNLTELDGWEIALYVMTLGYLFSEIVKVIKTMRLSTSYTGAISFWAGVSFLTEALLISAFALRMMGLNDHGSSSEKLYHFRSFQVLSCAAPLIWLRVLTVFENYQVVGVLQVVVFRMLRESLIFFILLALLSVGFAQALYALDTADGVSDRSAGELFNSLLQALMGAADFGDYQPPDPRFGYPFGLIIFYGWNFLTAIILLNILIALFGTAYSNIYDNAADEYLAFFAGKTVDLIRAPDNFVYPAPLNLIETFLVAPWEFVLPYDAYVKLNGYVMTVVFCIPLSLIALYESALHSGHGRLHDFFAEPIPEDDDDPKVINPESDDAGAEISKVPFDELIEAFPNTTVTESTSILRQIERVRKQLDKIEKELKKD